MTTPPATKVDITRQAFELRRKGHTYREIAAALGVSVGSVHAWCKEWAEEYNLQTTEQYQMLRSEESSRIDAAIQAIWAKVKSGDTDAINTMVRLQAQRAKYYPITTASEGVTVESTGTVTIKIGL